MFLPTVEVDASALQRGEYPFLRRGQWISVDGVKGRYIGISRVGVVWVIYGRDIGFWRFRTCVRRFNNNT